MFKEIMEQPKAMDTISTRIKEGKINLDDFKLTPEYIKDIDNVYIVPAAALYVGLSGNTLSKSLRVFMLLIWQASSVPRTDNHR